MSHFLRQETQVFFKYKLDDENLMNEEDYENWEDCESENEMDGNNNKKTANDIEMDLTAQDTHLMSKSFDDSEVFQLKRLVEQHKLMSLLVKTICRDNENSFQETDKIAHICNSIRFIRTEAAKCYSLLIENFYLNCQLSGAEFQVSDIEVEHLFGLLNVYASKPIEDLTEEPSGEESEALLETRLLDLIHDIFMFFNESQQFSLENRNKTIELIKQILFKYKLDVIELCIRMARIIGLMAIKLRNSNVSEGKSTIAVKGLLLNRVKLFNKIMSLIFNFIIKLCATILIELTIASFEQADQSKIETLQLNAELMDLLIDIFGEDNLLDLEINLNFIERIKWFSDKFYSKVSWLCLP